MKELSTNQMTTISGSGLRAFAAGACGVWGAANAVTLGAVSANPFGATASVACGAYAAYEGAKAIAG